MRLLELFSGTGSVGKVARELGWELTSMDLSPKYKPDYVADIMDFDFSIWPKGYFDMIWASPCCGLYSIAPAHLFTADERIARAEGGNAVSRRTMEVIYLLEPKWYAIENPYSSKIWTQGIFDHLPKKKVSYCMYSDWGYRKNTTIATNIEFEPKVCKGDCGYVRDIVGADGKSHRYHLAVAKQGVSAHCRGLGVQCTTHKQDELYRIPPKLIYDILEPISAVVLRDAI
jgi:hypothetical protein